MHTEKILIYCILYYSMIYRYILHIICVFSILFPRAYMYNIYISPGGLRGFYTYGICKFLKEKYDMTNYNFYGASAGAWNSLHMSLKQEYETKFNDIMYDMDLPQKSLYTMQENLKTKLLKNFDESHFELEKLHICVGHFKQFGIYETLYENFDDLEDAISCCMASSHIPIISGKLSYQYKNKYCIDGGIYGFITQKDTSSLVIYPEMFKFDFTEHDDLHKFDPKELVHKGYEDASSHRNKIEYYLYKN